MVGASLAVKTPRVSIITALYNHEKFVEQTIESVLAQTYQDFEYIIWDDGSHDRSLEIAKRYAAQHPKHIFVYTHAGSTNRGQEATRNEALKKARGTFFCLLDSDDYWLPRKLESQIAQMDTNPRIGLVYGPVSIFLHDSQKLLPAQTTHLPEGSVFDELVQSNFILACGVMVRRSCLESSWRFETRYGAIGEYPLWLHLAHGWLVAAVKEPLAVWRLHECNTGTTRRVSGRRELVDMVEGFLHDPKYASHEQALKQALVQYRYDLAVILAETGQTSEALEIFRSLSNHRNTPTRFKYKAHLMRTIIQAGPLPLALLTKFKRFKHTLTKPHALL